MVVFILRCIVIRRANPSAIPQGIGVDRKAQTLNQVAPLMSSDWDSVRDSCMALRDTEEGQMCRLAFSWNYENLNAALLLRLRAFVLAGSYKERSTGNQFPRHF